MLMTKVATLQGSSRMPKQFFLAKLLLDRSGRKHQRCLSFCLSVCLYERMNCKMLKPDYLAKQ
jgi:hypothetical protein